MTENVIERLVLLHGEGGLAPTKEDWRSIFAISGPVQIINLLKFHRTLELESSQVSGSQAYQQYADRMAAPFARVGGKVHFFGSVQHFFGLGQLDEWNAVIHTSYPSAGALAEMWLDAEFFDAHSSRLAALEKSQVLIFAG